jgi:hypothetical protein
MVNFASPPLCFRESSPLPVGQEGGWANSRSGRFGEEKKLLDPTGIRTPGRPIRAKLNTRSISRPCVYTGRSKSLCAPDDYSTKNTQKYFKQFQSLTMIT